MIQADGTGDTVLQPLGSTGQSYGLDWSADGRYLAATYGGEAQGAPPFRLLVFDLITHTVSSIFQGDNNLRLGAPGTVRISPDSRRIAYEVYKPDGLQQTVLIATANLDGTGGVSLPINLAEDTWLWWQRGPAIPAPARLTLSYSVPPDLLLLQAGGPSVQVLPTLFDAQGNVIVHAVGDWSPSDARYFMVDLNGNASGIRTQDTASLTLTASNGGITSTPSKVLVDLPVLQVKLQLIRNIGGNTEVRILFANSGNGGATNVVISSIALDGASPIEALPFYRGAVLAGTTDASPQTFNFLHSNKPSGTIVRLKIKGAYDWYGAFNTTLRVTLP